MTNPYIDREDGFVVIGTRLSESLGIYRMITLHRISCAAARRARGDARLYSVGTIHDHRVPCPEGEPDERWCRRCLKAEIEAGR
jgi:hypothetical protein